MNRLTRLDDDREAIGIAAPKIAALRAAVPKVAALKANALRVAVRTAALCVGLMTVHSAFAQTDAKVVDEPKDDAATAAASLKDLHDTFSKTLSGSTLQGHFTVDGQQGDLKEENYEIKSVTKLPSGDLWLFKVRIRYGDHDVNVPLPLTVSWADKTPVIVVDHLTIPGMGTFDARVVIADGRYAGTWQHGQVGGHLFGKILPPEPVKKDDDANAEP